MLEAAKNYARADKSDPFAYARALAHIKSGVATSARAAKARDNKWNTQLVREPAHSAFWDAMPSHEERSYRDLDDYLHEYTATTYSGRVRP